MMLLWQAQELREFRVLRQIAFQPDSKAGSTRHVLAGIRANIEIGFASQRGRVQVHFPVNHRADGAHDQLPTNEDMFALKSVPVNALVFRQGVDITEQALQRTWEGDK